MVSVVTGASSGLGKEIAKILSENGEIVYAVSRNKGKLLDLQKECHKNPGKIKIIDGDLTDSKFRENLISRIIKSEKKIDYFFNNAGIGRAILFEKQEYDDILKMIELNLLAYVHLTRLVLPHMRKRNKGRIIHIGSVVAFTPLPYFTIYDVTKSAIYSFNRALRYELKNSNVTSTVVLPARMKTGFADNSYDCYKKNGKDVCVKKFNSKGGNPRIVAKSIIKNMDKGKEVILPTFLSGLWYSMRYFGFAVDFVMKNFLGPKERKNIDKLEMK